MLQDKASIAEIELDVSCVMNSFLGLKGIISLNFCCILLKRRLVYSIQKKDWKALIYVCVPALARSYFYQGVRTCRHLQVGAGPLRVTEAFLQMVPESGTRTEFD